jgi:hypothetical protein
LEEVQAVFRDGFGVKESREVGNKKRSRGTERRKSERKEEA